MDPLSIASGVLGIAAFCGTVVKYASRFIADAKELPGFNRESLHVVHSLQLALENLGTVLKERPPPLDFEHGHFENIERITKSCRSCLEKLKTLLDDSTSLSARTRLALDINNRQDAIQRTIAHLASYAQVINLSVTSLSLGVLWKNQKSQDEIQAAIDGLAKELQNIGSFDDHLDQVDMPDDPAIRDNMAIASEIRDWRMSADHIVTAVSDYDLKSLTFGPPSTIFPPPSDLEPPFYDPEPEEPDDPGPDIRLDQIRKNCSLVDLQVSQRRYLVACASQRKSIMWKEELAERHGIPFSYAEKANMNERLADILLMAGSENNQAGSRENWNMGMAKLQAELDQECARPTGERDEYRRARLYHKIGRIYLDRDNRKQAIKLLIRAFNARKVLQPADLVRETAELLIRALRFEGLSAEAYGYENYLRTKLPHPHLPEQISDLSTGESAFDLAFGWCMERGFDMETRDTLFDICDSNRRTSPLHMAVMEEDIDMVKNMIDHVASFEHCDGDLATPLLRAASARNHEITRLLLEHGASPDARDANGMGPLHRCQSRSKGLEVAKLLLDTKPSLIDDQDARGRTALFMASDYGNYKMARLLLERGADPHLAEGHGKTPLYRACERGDLKMASELLKNDSVDPNVGGPGESTPLLIAISTASVTNNKMVIIQLLLDRGADTSIVDIDGQNAYAAARKSAFSSDIKALLQGDRRNDLGRSRRDSGYSTTEPTLTHKPSGSSSTISERARRSSAATRKFPWS